jgi:hypothetical protein
LIYSVFLIKDIYIYPCDALANLGIGGFEHAESENRKSYLFFVKVKCR